LAQGSDAAGLVADEVDVGLVEGVEVSAKVLGMVGALGDDDMEAGVVRRGAPGAGPDLTATGVNSGADDLTRDLPGERSGHRRERGDADKRDLGGAAETLGDGEGDAQASEAAGAKPDDDEVEVADLP
jgi:hypothetical protein